jgi:hypothetical protein
MHSRVAKSARRRTRRDWWQLSDAQLLQLRFSDLHLLLRGPLLRHVQQLYAELERRGIGFRPHTWLAEEWFSPDGVPGIALPFYLAHPRLCQLERRLMQQVEGGNRNWLMRILRHEAGHAIDTAYGLRRRAGWREVFGSASAPYPSRYTARPGSRRYVHHLGDWYAQSHPTEDFAETFAVWLKPKSDWRRSYESWPARAKLLYVDNLIAELTLQRPKVWTRRQIEPLSLNHRTLGEHYAERLKTRSVWNRGAVDDFLLRQFATRPRTRSSTRAATLLRACKPLLVSSVAQELGVNRYSVFQVVRMVIQRADQLGLYQRGARRAAVRSARTMLTRLMKMYLQGKSPQLSL